MEKKPHGRQKIRFTEKEFKQIKELCKIQCTQAEISAVMQVCDETLNREIREKFNLSFTEFRELHTAAGRASLRRVQFEQARSSPQMAMFLGKNYLNQKDKIEDDEKDGNSLIKILIPKDN